MSTTPIRFIVIDEPFYTESGRRRNDYSPAPVVGDVVEAGTERIDSDGDRMVRHNGRHIYISAEALVRVDVLLREREEAKAAAEAEPTEAEPLADWERELLGEAVPAAPPHGVTLDRAIVKPAKLADVLVAHGMTGETAEVLTALAVLRSVE